MAGDVRTDRSLTGTVPATPPGSASGTVEARSPARATPKQPTSPVDGQREAARPVAPSATANVTPALEGPRDPVAASKPRRQASALSPASSQTPQVLAGVRKYGEDLRSRGVDVATGPLFAMAPTATLTRELTLRQFAALVFRVPENDVHPLMLASVRSANPELRLDANDLGETRLPKGSTLSLTGATHTTRAQLEVVSAKIVELRAFLGTSARDAVERERVGAQLEGVQRYHVHLAELLRTQERLQQLAAADGSARRLVDQGASSSQVEQAYAGVLAAIEADAKSGSSASAASTAALREQALAMQVASLVQVAERRVARFEQALADARAPTSKPTTSLMEAEGFVPGEAPASEFDAKAELRAAEGEVRGAFAAAQRCLALMRPMRANDPARLAQLDAELANLRAGSNRLVAQLYVPTADEAGVLAAYLRSTAIPADARRWITHGPGAGRAQVQSVASSSTAIASLAPAQREQALAELEGLGNQLVATRKRGVRDDAQRIEVLLSDLGARLGRADLAVQAQLLGARRLAAQGDHADAVRGLEALVRSPPGKDPARTAYVEQATIELASTLNAWAMGESGSARHQAIDKLRALRLAVESQRPPVLAVEQRARLLMMEANALIQANRSREALHTLSNLQHPDYAKLGWVGENLAAFRTANQQGNAKAAWTVFASELNAESLGEAIVWTGGGAAAGAAAGAAIGVWFLGIGAVVGAGVGAVVGATAATAGLKAANVYSGWDRIMQARATGMSAHSVEVAVRDGALALVDLAGAFAPLKGASAMGKAGGALVTRSGSEAGRKLLSESMASIDKSVAQLGGRASTDQLERLAREELLRRFTRETVDFGGKAMASIALAPLSYQLAQVMGMPPGPERERAMNELFSAAGGMLALMGIFVGGNQLAMRGSVVRVANQMQGGPALVLRGVDIGLARMRPALVQDGAALREHDAMVRKAVTQQAELERVTSDIEAVRAEGEQLAARGLKPDAPEREANAARAAGLLRQFEQVTAEVDALRGAMLTFAAKYLPDHAEAVRREFGEVNPEMVAVHAQTKAAKVAKPESGEAAPPKSVSPRDAALFEYLSRFKSFRGMDVPEGVLAPGVRGVSLNVLRAGSELIRGRFASADREGAPNVEHVGSVLRDALATRARELGRPLTQKEVDLEFERTWATDGRGKNPSFDAIKDAPTVWGNRTVGEVSAEMRANARGAIVHDMEHQGVAAAVRAEVLRRFDEGKALGPPDSPPELAADVARVTDKVVKAHARHFTTNPFMTFVWFHGALAPEQVVQMARSAGGDLGRVSDLLEGYYGHHVSHFPSMGPAVGGLEAPDFHELVGRGLSPEAADRLNAQWKASLEFYGKWSPRFTFDTDAQVRGFSDAKWSEMIADAAPLRSAIANLTPEVRRQLISDDVGQFTHDGMPKWTAQTMNPPPGMPKPTTQAEFASRLASGPIAGYLWSNMARSYSSVAEVRAAVAQGSHSFVAQVQSMTRATGYVIDPTTLAMRPLRPGDPAFTERAWAIVNDAPLREAFAQATGGAGKSPAQLLEAHGPDGIIRWFDAQAADSAAVNRLAASRLPPLPAAAGQTISMRAVRQSMVDGTASRQIVVDHKEGRFARSAAQGLRERQAAGVPFAEAQRWYEQNWSRAVTRWNSGYGGRHGLQVDAHRPPPGLEPGQARATSYADLIHAAESRAFTVHTAADEAAGARMVGSNGGSAVARVEVGRGTAATPEARAQQVMRNLVHEIEGHWKDGFFEYKPLRTVDDAMYNLRGEAYASLRELFEFEPDRALRIIDNEAELRAFLEATAKEFAASPNHRAYFGAPGDAIMQQAIDRLARQGERFITPERTRGSAPRPESWVTSKEIGWSAKAQFDVADAIDIMGGRHIPFDRVFGRSPEAFRGAFTDEAWSLFADAYGRAKSADSLHEMSESLMDSVRARGGKLEAGRPVIVVDDMRKALGLDAPAAPPAPAPVAAGPGKQGAGVDPKQSDAPQRPTVPEAVTARVRGFADDKRTAFERAGGPELLERYEGLAKGTAMKVVAEVHRNSDPRATLAIAEWLAQRIETGAAPGRAAWLDVASRGSWLTEALPELYRARLLAKDATALAELTTLASRLPVAELQQLRRGLLGVGSGLRGEAQQSYSAWVAAWQPASRR